MNKVVASVFLQISIKFFRRKKKKTQSTLELPLRCVVIYDMINTTEETIAERVGYPHSFLFIVYISFDFI